MPQPFSNQWRLWPPDLDLTYDPRPPWTVCALCLRMVNKRRKHESAQGISSVVPASPGRTTRTAGCC